MKSFIIIGAGILGASTAYHLVKAGAKVIVVDRHDNGQATDAAAGIVNPWLTQRRNKAWYRLAKGGAKYYPRLMEQLESDGEKNTGYSKVGAISLHTDNQKLEKMVERAYKRMEDAPEMGKVSRFNSEKTIAMFPPLAKGFSSVYVSGGARVNGRAMRNSLLRAAKKHGAELINGEAELRFDGKRVYGVRVDNRELVADSVIVTAGAWANEVVAPLGINLLVSSQKAQIVHLKMEEANTEAWPVVMPPNNQYLVAFEDGKIVVGATHEDEVGFDCRTTAGGMHEVLDKALQVAPGLANSTVLETRVGFRPFTPGFLPVIGPIPEWEGIFVANGLGASGLTVGPYLGAELAKLVMDMQMEIDINDYDVAKAIVVNN